MTYDGNARRQYKAQARADIRGQFWRTMLTVVLQILPAVLIAMISEIGIGATEGDTGSQNMGLYTTCMLISLLASVFIMAPLDFGAKHYFVARARGQQASPMLLLSCFMNGRAYLTSIKLVLGILLYSLGWILLWIVAMIPILLAAATGSVLADSMAVMVIGIVLLTALTMLISVKIRRYDGAYICMIDSPDASVMGAIRSCSGTFKKHNWELWVFNLSFILWVLLGALTLGIVLIYVVAYQEIAFVHYFDALRGEKVQPDATGLTE